MNLVILLSQLVLFVSGSHAADQVFTTYYHNDVLGSPVAATDQNGDLKWREEYLPYGERYLQEYSSTGNSRWYTGHVHDQETELTYMGARYYDPVIGRFMGVDPVGFDEANIHSFNRYAYANNNPYKYVDPDGRAIETAWDIANVVMDVSSMGMNLAAGNYVGAAVDAGGLIVDLAATVIPGVPGGAGAAIKAVRGADKGLNGNSKLSQKAQHVYEIIDKKTGVVVKTGISGGKIGKNGKSYRAEKQVRKWGKEDYESTIIAEIPTGQDARVKALKIEANNASGLRASGQLDPLKHVRP